MAEPDEGAPAEDCDLIRIYTGNPNGIRREKSAHHIQYEVQVFVEYNAFSFRGGIELDLFLLREGGFHIPRVFGQ